MLWCGRPGRTSSMAVELCGRDARTTKSSAKHIQRLVEASDFGRCCPDELSVGRQNLWLIADHFDAPRGECFDLGILDVLSLEHRREEPQQAAPGDFPEQCDVEEPVVDLRLGRSNTGLRFLARGSGGYSRGATGTQN